MTKNQERLSHELAEWGVIRLNKVVSVVWLLLFLVIAAGTAYAVVQDTNGYNTWYLAAVRLTMAMQVIVMMITGLRWYYGKRIEHAVKDGNNPLGAEMTQQLNHIVQHHDGLLRPEEVSVQKEAESFLRRAVFVDICERLRKASLRR